VRSLLRRAFYHGPSGAVGSAARGSLTVRDAIAWASFCAGAVSSRELSMWEAYVHGAYLTLFDGLGLGLGIPEVTAKELRAACESFLRTQLPATAHATLLSASFQSLPAELGCDDGADDEAVDTFGAGGFRIQKVRVRRARFSVCSPFGRTLRVGFCHRVFAR
jgi:midasin